MAWLEEVPPTRRTSGPLPSADTPSPRARATSGRLRVTSLPACPAEALHLRFTREDPTAVQAEELPGALGPPIAQGRRRRALEVHRLSMIRNALGAQYRVGAEWARGTHRRHGVSLSRGHGARWYRPRTARGRTRSHPDSVTRCSSMSGGGLPSLSLRFGPLALALHGRLLVVGPPLHFLEHSALQHLPLEGLQRRLDLIIENLDPQWRTFLPLHGASWPPRTPRPGPRHGRPKTLETSGLGRVEPFRGLTPLAAVRSWGRDPAPRDDRNGGAKERNPSRAVTRGPADCGAGGSRRAQGPRRIRAGRMARLARVVLPTGVVALYDHSSTLEQCGQRP
jgi:hypothetical protein